MNILLKCVISLCKETYDLLNTRVSHTYVKISSRQTSERNYVTYLEFMATIHFKPYGASLKNLDMNKNNFFIV